MRNEPMRRNDLPETCFSILPSSGQLIIIRCGERGYYPSEWDTGNREKNRDIASSHNESRGISDMQESAMLAGSMFGWDTPGANPQWYLDNAKYANANILQGHVKDPVMSIYYPINGLILRYEIMGKQQPYLPMDKLPNELMGMNAQFIMQPDLVCGRPVIPVKVTFAKNGNCTVELERGSYVAGRIINADYDEEAFAKELQALWNEKQTEKPKHNKSELHRFQKRYDELSKLIRGLYENLVSGLLPERQYKQLMKQYDDEQAELETKIEAMEKELTEEKVNAVDIKHFISLIRKCKEPTEISDLMFAELIDKIVVYEAEGVGKARTQKVDIYFNYVGQIDIAYSRKRDRLHPQRQERGAEKRSVR